MCKGTHRDKHRKDRNKLPNSREKKGSPAARSRAQCKGRQDVCETPTMGARSRPSRYLVIMVVKVKDGVYEHLNTEYDCVIV